MTIDYTVRASTFSRTELFSKPNRTMLYRYAKKSSVCQKYGSVREKVHARKYSAGKIQKTRVISKSRHSACTPNFA
jgi:hypothetical protein